MRAAFEKEEAAMKCFENLTLTRCALLLVVAGLMLPMVVSSSSCTAIGYAIGNHVTRNDPPRYVEAGRGRSASVGTPMAIATKDSARLLGIYLGHAPLDDAAYAPRYDAWRARTPGAPALGASVTLVRGSRQERVSFLGFGYRALHVRRGERPEEDVPFARVKAVRADAGTEWTGEQLAALDARGELPSREALLLGRGLPVDWNRHFGDSHGITGGDMPEFHDTARVATDRVSLVEVPAARGARTAWTLAGLAVDASLVLAVAAVASMNSAWDFSGCDAASMGGFSMAALAPPPTTQDFDVLAGAFVADSLVAVPAPAAEPAATAVGAAALP